MTDDVRNLIRLSELDELCHSLREQRTASAVVNACTERIVAHIVSQLPENSADAV